MLARAMPYPVWLKVRSLASTLQHLITTACSDECLLEHERTCHCGPNAHTDSKHALSKLASTQAC